MALDEMTAVLRARAFLSKVGPSGIPVPMDGYLAGANATVRVEDDLQQGLLGMSFSLSGKNYICINGKDSAERQRFTICHEIAHVVLGLQSDHKVQWWSAKRPMSERLCDVFAAELLLPDHLFQAPAEAAPISLASIDRLAADFQASVTSTGSRYASVVTTPCAFILSEDGKVRHSSRSKALIDAHAWIAPRIEVPPGTLSHRVRTGTAPERSHVSADVWFSDWERGGTLLEEARHLPKWDQTLSLIWFESEEVPVARVAWQERRWEYEGRDTGQRRDEEDQDGLKELDGNLRWSRRDRYR